MGDCQQKNISFESFMANFPKTHIDKDTENINALQKTKLPILIYGVGDVANAIFEYLYRFDIFISAFFVDSHYHEQDNFRKTPCYSLEDALCRFNQCNVIIGFANYKDGIEILSMHKEVKEIYCFANPYATSTQQLTYTFFNENAHKFYQAYKLFDEPFSRDLFMAYIRSQIYKDAKELFAFNWKSKKADSNHNAFFNNDIIRLNDSEIYFDGGAFDGKDIQEFISSVNNYHQIFAVEPDSHNFNILKSKCSSALNIEVHQLALWDASTSLTFEFDKGQQSGVAEQLTSGDTTVKADKIDNILAGRPITLLKLNIRASEYKALSGASETIQKYQPKIICFISIANDSLFSLPQLINRIHPEYSFYLRCDYPMFFRVYLYAVKKRGNADV